MNSTFDPPRTVEDPTWRHISSRFTIEAMPAFVPLNKRIVHDAGQCMRLGFLRVRDRQSRHLDEPSAADQVVLMQGIRVGQKAREQFPDGVLIQAESFSDALAHTQMALINQADTLFEAAFAFEGVGMKADILR